MNEQKLNQKLAEWVPLEYTIDIIDRQIVWIKDPDTGQWCKNWLTQSLDACFKWLVPKLIYFSVELSGEGQYAGWARTEKSKDCKMSTAPTPALALCLAIEKLLSSEKVP